MTTQIPRQTPPPEDDPHIWVHEPQVGWWRMCENNTHPRGYICCRMSEHEGPHVAEFSGSNETEKW